MHGRLPCDLYRSVHGSQEHVHGTCGLPSCADLARWASLVHIFVECPAYAEARTWLADTWAAIAGQQPPLTAAVLLGDCSPAWPAYPTAPAQAELWNALRLSWLLALWEAHSQPLAEQRCSFTVVAATVRSLRHLIRAQYCMCCSETHVFATLPCRILTRAVTDTALDAFNGRWGHNGVLCTAVAQPGGSSSLQLLLSMQHPVPAPQPPLPPPPEAAAAV
jgi:hypothetical protein